MRSTDKLHNSRSAHFGACLTRAALLSLMLVAFAVSCGGGSSENQELVIGDIGWDENIAVSNLTKALLEDELGYENVELRTLDVAPLFEGVSNGDLDAFQDVWLPNHQQFVDEQGGDVELLDPWFQGTTSFGIAVPSYMSVTSIDQLNDTGAEEIFGIEPTAVIMDAIPDKVIPAYGLEQDLVQASTPGMLAEVERRYNREEDFAFVAWSPHWMNQRYDFRLLEDPEGSLGELTEPAELRTIVKESLRNDDPVAYAYLAALTLTEEQVNDLEDTINETGDPLTGARLWATANPQVVQPWLDAAEAAREG